MAKTRANRFSLSKATKDRWDSLSLRNRKIVIDRFCRMVNSVPLTVPITTRNNPQIRQWGQELFWLGGTALMDRVLELISKPAIAFAWEEIGDFIVPWHRDKSTRCGIRGLWADLPETPKKTSDPIGFVRFFCHGRLGKSDIAALVKHTGGILYHNIGFGYMNCLESKFSIEQNFFLELKNGDLIIKYQNLCKENLCENSNDQPAVLCPIAQPLPKT